MKYHIRKAVLYDAQHSEFLNTLSYERRTESWEYNIKTGNVFVAVTDDQQIVGFSSGGKERTGDYENFPGELYAIYMLKEYQRLGIGKLLVKPVVNELVQLNVNSMLVWVLEDNKSKQFYENLGGEPVDVKQIEIAGRKYNEIAYGWRNIKALKEGVI